MRDYLVFCGKKADFITVISFVSEQVLRFCTLDQGDGPWCIVALSGGDDKVKRIAQRVAQAMDFC